MKFSPLVMCMDLARFKEQVDMLNEWAEFSYFNQELTKISKLPIGAHLMVANPSDFIDMTIDPEASFIHVHTEPINGDCLNEHTYKHLAEAVQECW